MRKPTKRTVAGVVEAVTIPAAEYAELLRCRRQFRRLKLLQSRFQRRRRIPIEADLEVALFIADRVGKLNAPAIMAECIATFGAARTPSRSAFYRIAGRIRELARSSHDVQPDPA